MALVPYMSEQGAWAFSRSESLVHFVRREDYSYMLGPDILVAPMLEPGTAVLLRSVS